MNFKQYIQAITLFFTITLAQPAQAGLWDWCTSPVYWFAGYVWIKSFATKHEFSEFKINQQETAERQFSRIVQEDTQREAGYDKRFKAIFSNQDSVKHIISQKTDELRLLKGEVNHLKNQMTQIVQERDSAVLGIKNENDSLKKELAVALALVIKLQEQFEQDKTDIDQKTKPLSEQLMLAKAKATEIDEIQQKNIKQVESQAKQITGINSQLKNLAASENKLRINMAVLKAGIQGNAHMMMNRDSNANSSKYMQ